MRIKLFALGGESADIFSPARMKLHLYGEGYETTYRVITWALAHSQLNAAIFVERI